METHLAGQGHSVIGRETTKDKSYVRKLMLDTWNERLLTNIKERLHQMAMKLVNAERNGIPFNPFGCNTQHVIGLRQSYVNLCTDPNGRLRTYYDNFEPAYLEAIVQYYSEKCQQYVSMNGLQKYIMYAYEKRTEEEKRGLTHLETSSQCSSMADLTRHLTKVFVAPFKNMIIEECTQLLEVNETKKLNVLFSLIDSIQDGINPMLQASEEYIIRYGVTILCASSKTIIKDPQLYIGKLLEIFNHISVLVKEAFQNDERFLTFGNEAYKEVVNDTSVFQNRGIETKTQPESKGPELLANFCDMIMKKSVIIRKMSEEEREQKLRGVVQLMKYITNKDAFMQTYKCHLACRLVRQASANVEMEEYLVMWLDDAGMPPRHVNQLRHMFHDMKLSKDLNKDFRDAHGDSNKLDINMFSLKASSWPCASEHFSVKLPKELANYVQDMEAFYAQKYCGRKLQWHHMMGNGLVEYKSNIGKYELEVSTYQLAVLFSFNEQPDEQKIDFKSLLLATKLPENELKKTLAPLTMQTRLKRQVLLHCPPVMNANDFSNETEFWTRGSGSTWSLGW